MDSASGKMEELMFLVPGSPSTQMGSLSFHGQGVLELPVANEPLKKCDRTGFCLGK